MKTRIITITLILLLAALPVGATEWGASLPIFYGGSFDGWDRNAMAASVKVNSLDVSLSSGTDQTFAWTTPSAALATLTITATSPDGTITNGGTLRVTVPAAWGCRFDASAGVTLGGSAASGSKVGAASYADGGRTLSIPVTADFANGDTLTIAGLKLLDLAFCSAGNQRLELDFTGDGVRDVSDTYRLTLTVPWPGGSFDGWDRYSMAASAGLGGAEVTLASGTDQTFAWTTPSAALATLTMTVTSPAGSITNGGTMRVFVPAGWGCRFDASAGVTLGGSAVSGNKVGAASYADGGRTLAIPVTVDFADGETLTIAGLKLLDLALCSAGNQRLELDFTGDGSPDKYDENTLTLSVPWPGGPYDGWDRGAMAESKEIKLPGGTLFTIR